MAHLDARPRAPRLERSRSDRWIGGVAGGIAQHLGVQSTTVRIAFVVLAFAAGFGIVVYVLTWIQAPLEAEDGSAERVQRSIQLPAARRAVGIGLVIAGLLALLWVFGLWFEGNLAWPVVLGAIGFAVLWARGDGTRGRLSLETLGMPLSPLRFVIGSVLILGGMAVFLAGRTSLESLGNVLVGMIVALGGAALLAGPWIWTMGRQLVEERSSRVRSEERAEMAAHLHDSVLQTLALIQRSRSTREMTSLARTQERELRAWLYGTTPAVGGTRLRDAIDAMAGRIERQHQVSVEAVVVGDAEMDERITGLVNACAEAVANSAVHSGTTTISVYVEVETDAVTAFVRDQGSGFDPAAVPADRRGIADSIVGRMARHGGTATVNSRPGEGTEVVLKLPRRAP